MKVIAIDPGQRVGWATGVVTGMPVNLTIANHGIHHLKDFALKLGESFTNYDVVIYETWRLSAVHARKMVGDDMQSSQLIGVIRYLSWIHPEVQIVSQGPAVKATANRTMPDDIRKIIDGLPKSHDDSHDGDAIRHLYHWYWSKYV